jgi:hypothetical protein
VSHLALAIFLAGECGGEGEEGAEQVGVVFVADGEPVVVEEPGDAAFDDPAILAEGGAGVDACACDAGCDPSVAESSAQFGGVVGLVGVRLGGPCSSGTSPRAHCGDGFDQWCERVSVVGVRRRDTHGQRQSGAVGQDVDLRTGLARSTGFGPVNGMSFSPGHWRRPRRRGMSRSGTVKLTLIMIYFTKANTEYQPSSES